jgi:nucleoid DNA-binding protein
MEKPISLSVKNFLIRKLASDMLIPEKTIETVVNHQFGSALNALQLNNSVELSGFGKFVFNKRKAIRAMEKLRSQEQLFSNILQDNSLSEHKRHSNEIKLENVKKNIEFLKPKLNEN